MSQGFLVNVSLMVMVAVLAVLTAMSQTAALVTAAGLVLFAGAARRLETLPTVALYVIVALVPLSYLSALMSVGALNSFTKLVFIPAVAVLMMDWILSKRTLVLGRQGAFVVLFGLVLSLSFVVNDSTPHSFWFLTRFISVILLFFLCANALRTERDLSLLMMVVVGACVVSALGSQFVPVMAAGNATMNNGSVVRMTGWSQDDAPTFGTNLLVALLIFLYFAFVSHRVWFRCMLFSAAGMLALAIAFTYARGITLVLGMSVIFLLFKVRKRVPILLVTILLGLMALCLVPFVPHMFWDRMTTITQFSADSTIGRRLDTFRIGWELFSQRPLLGFGPGNFIVQYMSPEFRFDRTGVSSGCFNLYISIATQAGVLGLAALGLIVWSSFRELHFVARSYGSSDAFLKQASEVLEIMLVAILLVSLFEPTDLQKYLWIVFGAIAAAGHIRRGQLSPAPAPS